MAKVSFEVNERDLDTVLTILNNLKEGLIKDLQVEKKRHYNKPKPVVSEPLKPVEVKSKYIDGQTFKERLKRMRQSR